MAYRSIPLNKGFSTKVDLDDYEFLMQWKWYISSWGYVIRKDPTTHKTITMHRVIMKAPKRTQLDHINRDKLDNRKFNLRFSTPSQNSTNRIRPKGKSGYRGVLWFAPMNAYQVRITSAGKRYFIGYFKDKIKAAKAYDKAARNLHTTFAVTNFK